MNFDDVRRAAAGSFAPDFQARSGSVGKILAAAGVWTALGGSGFQVRSDVSAEAEWAVAVDWPARSLAAVAARLLVPGPIEGLQQYAEPAVTLDCQPTPGVVVAHYVTTYPAPEAGQPERVNHVMIRKAPEAQ